VHACCTTSAPSCCLSWQDSVTRMHRLRCMPRVMLPAAARGHGRIGTGRCRWTAATWLQAGGSDLLHRRAAWPVDAVHALVVQPGGGVCSMHCLTFCGSQPHTFELNLCELMKASHPHIHTYTIQVAGAGWTCSCRCLLLAQGASVLTQFLQEAVAVE
jgi:hypothetical protein